MKELKNNPLARMISEPAEQEEKENGKGRPRKTLVREKGSKQGLPEEYTRATFILKCEQLDVLKDIAYTERKPIKEVIEEMAARYIADKETEYQEKGKEILKH